ncbi:MAG TPA: hypothetical protein VLV87_09855 [Gammaproteobacteria bacterium]|nr:hypothetical protein [Gammaproteobacteria bacterium]
MKTAYVLFAGVLGAAVVLSAPAQAEPTPGQRTQIENCKILSGAVFEFAQARDRRQSKTDAFKDVTHGQTYVPGSLLDETLQWAYAHPAEQPDTASAHFYGRCVLDAYEARNPDSEGELDVAAQGCQEGHAGAPAAIRDCIEDKTQDIVTRAQTAVATTVAPASATAAVQPPSTATLIAMAQVAPPSAPTAAAAATAATAPLAKSAVTAPAPDAPSQAVASAPALPIAVPVAGVAPPVVPVPREAAPTVPAKPAPEPVVAVAPAPQPAPSIAASPHDALAPAAVAPVSLPPVAAQSAAPIAPPEPAPVAAGAPATVSTASPAAAGTQLTALSASSASLPPLPVAKAAAAGPPPDLAGFGKLTIGMPMDDAYKAMGSHGDTEWDSQGEVHTYMIGDGHGFIEIRPSAAGTLYSIRVVGGADAHVAPILNVALGDGAFVLMNNVGLPSSRTPLPGDKELWNYVGRNYAFEISPGGDVIGVRIVDTSAGATP